MVIDCPVERVADTVLVRGAALMRVEDTDLGGGFAALFAGSGAHGGGVGFHHCILVEPCVNSVGALNALTLKPNGVLQEHSMRRLGMAMMGECAAVGRAEGAHLEDSIDEEVMELYVTYPVDSVNSLLADRLTSRRMEWDARTGAIVQGR